MFEFYQRNLSNLREKVCQGVNKRCQRNVTRCVGVASGMPEEYTMWENV